MRCAYCSDSLAGVTTPPTIHRDGDGKGPLVSICPSCAGPGNPTNEQMWMRISTWRNITFAIAEGFLESTEFYDPMRKTAPPWATAIATAFARSTVWARVNPTTTLGELLQVAAGASTLQGAIVAGTRTHANAYDILDMTTTWETTDGHHNET